MNPIKKAWNEATTEERRVFISEYVRLHVGLICPYMKRIGKCKHEGDDNDNKVTKGNTE